MLKSEIILKLTEKETNEMLDHLFDVETQYFKLHKTDVANNISKLRTKIINQYKKQL